MTATAGGRKEYRLASPSGLNNKKNATPKTHCHRVVIGHRLLCVINLNNMEATKEKKATTQVITPEALFSHWQGHRKLTRRVIEAFPEDKLFTFSIGGMRPFAALVMEMLGMAVPTLEGVVTRRWPEYNEIPLNKKENHPTTKDALLALWDDATVSIDNLWPQIPEGRFLERDTAFGQWEGPIHWILFYNIDNEVHHRAQGYVYLRALGIEPPPFWER